LNIESGTTVLGLIQRVSAARVEVDGSKVADIGPGLLAFIGVERDDTEYEAERLLARIAGYRVFPDHDGRMNLSLLDVGGELLLVPQFTLAADTRKGTRASFGPAADPALGEKLFRHMVKTAEREGLAASSGVFGAHMKVALENDGPVTFLLTARTGVPRLRKRGGR
jgi:D-tyrosyl-tRNA(Tyr) deacylase